MKAMIVSFDHGRTVGPASDELHGGRRKQAFEEEVLSLQTVSSKRNSGTHQLSPMWWPDERRGLSPTASAESCRRLD